MNSAFLKPATRWLRQPILQIAVRNLRSLGLRLERLAPRLEDQGAEARGYVLHRGYRLPPPSMRGRMCGDAFRTDSFFFLSAVLEATRFPDRLGYTRDSRVVDIGSGLGRLATGLLAEFGDVQYLGIDANEPFVRWCKDNIEKQHPSFRFLHLDMANALYNPGGSFDGSRLRLPLQDGSADIAFLWGLYTNMKPGDVEAYNREIGRILRPGGRCLLTAFVEDGVEEVSINPPDYVPYACDGPLTVVRYGKPWLFSSFQRHGLRVEDFRYHGSMFPKQSEIYLVKD